MAKMNRDTKTGRYTHIWCAVVDKDGHQIGSLSICDHCGKIKGTGDLSKAV